MEFQAKDIASFLNGEIVGNSNVRIFKVSKIEEGEPGSLSFLSNPKYENYLYTTRASVVLVNKEFEPRAEIGATLIKVDDAYQAFASLLDLFAQTTQIKKKELNHPVLSVIQLSMEPTSMSAFLQLSGRMLKSGKM